MAEIAKTEEVAEDFHKLSEECSENILDMVEKRGIAADKRVEALRKELAELDALDEHIREIVSEMLEV